MAGKLVLKECNTPREEEKTLRDMAIKSAKIKKAEENINDFVRVKTFKGFMFVKKQKYLANKDEYDKESSKY